MRSLGNHSGRGIWFFHSGVQAAGQQEHWHFQEAGEYGGSKKSSQMLVYVQVLSEVLGRGAIG